MSRGPELSAEERAARQICKVVGERSLARDALKVEYSAVLKQTYDQRRPALREEDWGKALASALARGWIVEKDGCFSATEAGRLIARRSRAAIRKSRGARLRSIEF